MREQGKTFEVGDEVLTAGGIVGYVIDIEDDRVTLETSVGASFVVLKQYVLRTLEEPVPAEPDDEADYDDTEYGELDGHEDEAETETERTRVRSPTRPTPIWPRATTTRTGPKPSLRPPTAPTRRGDAGRSGEARRKQP